MTEINYISSNKELGKKLKEARKRAKLTQNQAGKMVSVDRSSIAFYELGRNLPNIFTLIKLAKIYNTEINHFITQDS